MTPSRLGAVALVVALAVDQATKQVALDAFSHLAPVRLLPVLELTLAWNRGVSFGFFGAGGVPAWAFILLSLAISAVLLRLMTKSGTSVEAAGYGLIVGGAVGNAIDRGIYGAVIDFIHVFYGAWSFPVFNIADTAITCGVGLILIDSLWPRPASTTS